MRMTPLFPTTVHRNQVFKAKLRFTSKQLYLNEVKTEIYIFTLSKQDNHSYDRNHIQRKEVIIETSELIGSKENMFMRQPT